MVYSEFYKIEKTAFIYNSGKGEIDQKAAKRDRKKQKRLKILYYRKIQKDERYKEHQQIASAEGDDPRLIYDPFKGAKVEIHFSDPPPSDLSGTCLPNKL